MKKYLLYKDYSVYYRDLSMYFLLSLDDFKRPFDPDMIYGKEYKIIAVNGDYWAKYMLLSDNIFNHKKICEAIFEFNSDEDAILWFRLTYGENL